MKDPKGPGMPAAQSGEGFALRRDTRTGGSIRLGLLTKFNICSDYRLSVEQLNWDGEEQCDREEFFLSIVCLQISFFPFSKLNEVFIIKV